MSTSGTRLRFFFDFIGKSNFFIALASALSVCSVYVLYDQSISSPLTLIVFFSTFFIYNIQRVVGNSNHWEVLHPSIKIAIVISAAAIGFLVFYLELEQSILLALAGIVSLLYSLPIVNRNDSKLSLRDLPRFKIWIIVLVWTMVIAIAPFLSFSDFGGFDSDFSIFIFSLQQASFIFALTVPFDIRDRFVDANYQQTIPMVLGVDKSISIAVKGLWVSFFLMTVNVLLGYFDLSIILIQAIALYISSRLILASREPKDQAFYTIKIDGMIALQAVLIILFGFI